MNLTAFLVYCVVVTFTPGPTNIVILSTVQHNSLKQAMKYVWGATLAFGLLLAASALLNRILAGVLPGVLTVMQAVGSLYMLYLAVQIYRMNTAEAQNHNTSGFASGLLMQFINPKVILFTLTVIPGYVLPYYSSPLTLAVFVIVITVIGFLAFMAWLVFGAVFRAFLQAHRRTANTVMALFMVYSAVMVSGIF
ncbi:LysE family translocator [Paenibacillus typhae]|uniref:LysE family translocator n=1 Tax=Paenibacillus typhae TaxID=1174501 RepID=UPI001C8D6335|nr:LysE family transporter [Paenibacillus typhae]MBY0010740.1 LysE family transporter [Paenibacillus typhae]